MGYYGKKSEKKPGGGAKKKKSAAVCPLNDDMVEYGILPRLPAKALLRLQCVSRKWRALISGDPHFVYLQSRRPSSALLHRWIPFGKPVGLVSRYPRSVGIPPRLSPHTQGQGTLFYFGTLVASCSGILCVNWRGYSVENPDFTVLFIGNPALEDWLPLPFPDHITRFDSAGLAVDLAPAGGPSHAHACYNLVLIVRFERDERTKEYGFFVFSSRTQQWRLSKERIVVPRRCWNVGALAVYVKGCLYWTLGTSRVLWFDPNEERSGLQVLPSEQNPYCWWRIGAIGEWNDKLSYAIIKREEIQVWSMDEVQSSCWSKIHSISLEKISRGLRKTSKKHWRIFVTEREVSLMPFQDDGDALWFFLEGAIYCYDTATEEVSRQAGSRQPYLFPYKDSLVYLPKP